MIYGYPPVDQRCRTARFVPALSRAKRRRCAVERLRRRWAAKISRISPSAPRAVDPAGIRSDAAGSVHPGHSPEFRLDERSLAYGIETLVAFARGVGDGRVAAGDRATVADLTFRRDAYRLFCEHTATCLKGYRCPPSPASQEGQSGAATPRRARPPTDRSVSGRPPRSVRRARALVRSDVRRILAQLNVQAGDVEDLAQEVFLRIFRNLHRFRGQSSFYTWLYRITVNVFFDHNKKRKRADVRLARLQNALVDVTNERHDGEDPYFAHATTRLTRESIRGDRRVARGVPRRRGDARGRRPLVRRDRGSDRHLDRHGAFAALARPSAAQGTLRPVFWRRPPETHDLPVGPQSLGTRGRGAQQLVVSEQGTDERRDELGSMALRRDTRTAVAERPSPQPGCRLARADRVRALVRGREVAGLAVSAAQRAPGRRAAARTRQPDRVRGEIPGDEEELYEVDRFFPGHICRSSARIRCDAASIFGSNARANARSSWCDWNIRVTAGCSGSAVDRMTAPPQVGERPRGLPRSLQGPRASSRMRSDALLADFWRDCSFSSR